MIKTAPVPMRFLAWIAKAIVLMFASLAVRGFLTGEYAGACAAGAVACVLWIVLERVGGESL